MVEDGKNVCTLYASRARGSAGIGSLTGRGQSTREREGKLNNNVVSNWRSGLK